MSGLRFAFFGSSLVSSYWNGACTYYRGIIRSLHERGHRTTFYEPRAYERQEHRDIPDPDWADVVIYGPEDAAAMVARARDVDVIVKTSGVGVNDELLEVAVADVEGPWLKVFWDVDAPATLASVEADADNQFRELIPEYDLVLTYGGGDPVVRRYEVLGAQQCIPVYNALDPSTHHPVPPQRELAADLSFLGNRLPDREARVEEFFLRAAQLTPQRSFLLGGSGWQDKPLPPNVRWIGHVGTKQHNALNRSALAVLNVTRDSMVANGWSPPTRMFEAAGAGACVITDAWDGIEDFLEPDSEVLVAHDGAEVAEQVDGLGIERARAIGAAARERICSEHTYAQRAEQLESILAGVPR
jgi:spore maturation protein CgeB